VKVLYDLPTKAVSLGIQGLLLYNPLAERREKVEQTPSPRAEAVLTVVGISTFSKAVMVSICR